MKCASKYFPDICVFVIFFWLEIALPYSDASFSKFEISAKMSYMLKASFFSFEKRYVSKGLFSSFEFYANGSMLIDLVLVYLLQRVISQFPK